MQIRLKVSALLILALGYINTTLSNHSTTDDDLSELTSLMDMEVVSSNKFKQSISDVAAAIYVITADEIVSSGALNLPSLLRQVPGLEVSQVTASSWAISIRGFNSGFSNKLLVMVDGRSVYSPLFSGVFWNTMDMDLNLIERIEVIRGAGSTTWGANAVNGVINIITKAPLKHDQESVSVDLSTQGKLVGVYSGFSVSENIHSLVNVSFRNWHGLSYPNTGDDEWTNRSLFSKWEYIEGAEHVKLTVDLSVQDVNDPLLVSLDGNQPTNNFDHTNHFVSLDWAHVFRPGLDLAIHADAGESKRQSSLYTFDDDLRNVALDLKISLDEHAIIVGAGYRNHKITLGNEGEFFSTHNNVGGGEIEIKSFYISDAWQANERLQVQFGVKIEDIHHDIHADHNFDDTETLPNVRFVYDLENSSNVWASWNKSSRIPALAEHLLFIKTAQIEPYSEANPTPWPMLILTSSNHNFKSEDNEIVEVGYRTSFSKNDLFDLVLYRSEYENLRTTMPQQPICVGTGLPVPQCLFPDDTSVMQLLFTNGAAASMKGLEATYRFNFTPNETLVASWTYQTLTLQPYSDQIIVADSEYIYPKHKVDLSYQKHLSDNWQLYTQLNYVEFAKHESFQTKPMPRSRAALDINFNYNWSEKTRLSFGLKNLLVNKENHYYSEFIQGQSGSIEKQAYLSIQYQW
jgi:iron complex outermembrane recepter protein